MAHHMVKDGELEEVGQLQLLLHSLYAKYEPLILRIIHRIIKIGFLRGRGKPILRFMGKALSILPTGEVVSLERAKEFIDAISKDSEIAVGPCVCQEALGLKKGIHVKDMTVLYGAEAYKRVKSGYKNMSPDEAKRLLDDLQEEGCMQTFYACMRSKGWVFVICNCESEICLPFRVHRLVGGVLSPGPDIVDWDGDKCIECGRCVERCHFGANRLVNGSIEVDLDKCYGCGLCVSTCPAEARRLVEREDYSNTYYPLDLVNRLQREERRTT